MMWMNGRAGQLAGGIVMLVLAGWMGGCAASQPTAGNTGEPAGNQTVDVTWQTTQKQPSPDDLFRLLQPRDRVLFVGDDLTQQGYYGRGVATALLSMHPSKRWRFFQGGREGATAQNAGEWVGGLLALTKPQVVFLCFGFNDGRGEDPLAAKSKQFREGLSKLVRQAKRFESVRRVVVISPPPVDTKLTRPAPPLGLNEELAQLTIDAWQVAEEEGVGFINVFEYMRQSYIAANAVGGDPLTMSGRLPLPTDEGHAIMASVILKGMGVTRGQLNPTGWTPLPRRRAYRVRQAMAIPLDAATVEQADRSYDLFMMVQLHDEAFFRAWRIAGRRPSALEREEAMELADQKWADVLAAAISLYGDSEMADAPPDMNAGTGTTPATGGAAAN